VRNNQVYVHGPQNTAEAKLKIRKEIARFPVTVLRDVKYAVKVSGVFAQG
jgi:hypothetical protein